jgi:hypothetical protein
LHISEDDADIVAAFEDGDSMIGVGCLKDHEAGILQLFGNVEANESLVFDDKHGRGFRVTQHLKSPRPRRVASSA